MYLTKGPHLKSFGQLRAEIFGLKRPFGYISILRAELQTPAHFVVFKANIFQLPDTLSIQRAQLASVLILDLDGDIIMELLLLMIPT